MATMRLVPLSNFLDFVLKSGTPKLTVVQQFKQQDKYDPKTDFYKKLREEVISCLSRGKNVTSLMPWADTVTEKKRKAYRLAVGGVGKFIGRKAIQWFEPPRQNHELGPMTVIVNPELGLVLNGQPHVIKLYLKDEPLKGNRAELILHLMRTSLGPDVDGKKLGVLDARAGKLFSAIPKTRGLDALLLGEAASFAAMFGRS